MEDVITKLNDSIDLQGKDIPRITDSVIFEHLCRDLWKNKTDKYEHVDLNGRKGQRQDGVDVYGCYIDSGNWFGMQCKVRKKSLEESEVREDIENAKSFTPKISKYIFVTTALRDAKIQGVIRSINSSKIYKFSIEIIFWEDIEEMLQEKQNFDTFYKNYHSFFVDNSNFGYSIGKLFTLNLGLEDDYDSSYELMIGHIPNYKNKKPLGHDYYRNAYYIANLNKRTVEFFSCDKNKPSCFPSDIAEAFKNEYDCWRISEWLLSIDDINKIINSDDDKFHYSVTHEQWKHYHERLTEEF